MRHDPRPAPGWRHQRVCLASPPLRWSVVVFWLIGMSNALYLPLLARWPTASWAIDVLTATIVPLRMIAFAVRRHEATLTELRLRASTGEGRGRFEVTVLLVTMPVVSVMVWWLTAAVTRFVVPESTALVELPWHEVLPAPGTWRDGAIAYLSVSAGAVEEIVYRAALLRALPPGAASSWQYPALSGVLFALIHREQGIGMVVRAAGFGYLAATVYRSSPSVWPLIAAPAALDLFEFGSMFTSI